jgi:hypothetical protein
MMHTRNTVICSFWVSRSRVFIPAVARTLDDTMIETQTARISNRHRSPTKGISQKPTMARREADGPTAVSRSEETDSVMIKLIRGD